MHKCTTASVCTRVRRVLRLCVADTSTDVDRKMRLYAVITALKNGFFPSNDQIDQTLKYATSRAPFEVKELSKDGQKLVNDTRTVIETVGLSYGGEHTLTTYRPTLSFRKRTRMNGCSSSSTRHARLKM